MSQEQVKPVVLQGPLPVLLLNLVSCPLCLLPSDNFQWLLLVEMLIYYELPLAF